MVFIIILLGTLFSPTYTTTTVKVRTVAQVGAIAHHVGAVGAIAHLCAVINYHGFAGR